MAEKKRQQSNIELIASENFVTEAVMEAQGSYLTNKYAEGYPGKRYYGGCEHVDVVENIARDRVKEIFGAEYANVQPHSGAQANMAVYFAVLEPGDTVLGMNLSHGGHLTHGSPVNFSGELYNFVDYGVGKEDELIDYEDVRQKALEHKPKMIVAGASAYPREIDFAKFREIADEVGAYLFVDMAHIAGLVAVGEHQNPVPHAHFVTSTTHKTLRGPRGGLILSTEEFGRKLEQINLPRSSRWTIDARHRCKSGCIWRSTKTGIQNVYPTSEKNAKALAEALIAEGVDIVSGGTDNHLVLLNLRSLEITGKIAEHVLDEVGITVNKNTIPFDTESPFVTSGVRLGTPAVTTRGFKEEEMKEIASIMAKVLKNHEDEAVKKEAQQRVTALTDKFPLYA